jgi:hypothetical protein
MTNTLPVTWHEDRITGCIQRAGEITNTTDPDEPCTIDWLDLACLRDIAREFLDRLNPHNTAVLPPERDS